MALWIDKIVAFDPANLSALIQLRYGAAAFAGQLRADFDAMPPRKQEETIDYVRMLLDEEGRDYARRRRRVPSQLAFVAYRVYGIWVDWLPAQVQMPTEPIAAADNEPALGSHWTRILAEVSE